MHAFLRAVFGKDRDFYRSITAHADEVFRANQRAVDHFNKAIDLHVKVTHRREMIARREQRMTAHGARTFKGGIL